MNADEKIPPPGSDAAIKAGCLCPVLDNAHGRGLPNGKDEPPSFWIAAGCPLHGREAKDGH